MKRDLSREILHFYLGNKKMRVPKMDQPLAVGFVSGSSAPGLEWHYGSCERAKKASRFLRKLFDQN